MPTLFRLLITLLFLAGLVFAGMFALVSFVDPQPKPISQKIPTRELLGTPDDGPAGLGIPLPRVESTQPDDAPAAPASP